MNPNILIYGLFQHSKAFNHISLLRNHQPPLLSNVQKGAVSLWQKNKLLKILNENLGNISPLEKFGHQKSLNIIKL